MDIERPQWSMLTKSIVIVVLLVMLGYGIHKFSGVIPPLILSIIIAYVFSPLVNIFQKRLRIHRVLAILLVYLLFILLITAILMIVIPILIDQFKIIGQDLQLWLLQARAFLGGQVVIAGMTFNGQDILTQLTSSLQTLFEPVFGTTLDIIARVLSSLVWVVFIFVVSIYLIKDSADLMAWLEKLPPPGYKQDFIRLREEVNTIWSAFFRGQLLLSLIVMTIVTFEGLIIGLPFALLMGVLAGLMEFLPSIGHGIWLIVASLVALLAGSTWIPLPHWAFWALLVGLHILFTQFDLNYLIPRIIGRSVHLPPVVVILGIVAGASLAGVMGVVLAAPTIASLRVIGRYVYAHLVGMEPFPVASVSQPLPPPNLRWWKIKPMKMRRRQMRRTSENMQTSQRKQ